MRIAVCAPQIPFVHGGAEILAETLVDELRKRDHQTELITIPFKWYPGAKVLSQALLWRLADLEDANGEPIERVIATKFPAYVVRHPNKVVWLLHQFRQAYDYDRTDLGQFGETPFDRATVRAVHRLDRTALGEAKAVFATSENVATRLEKAIGLKADILPHPPQRLDYRCDDYGDFILSVGRLDIAKRIDLLLEALALGGDPSIRVVVVGEGPDRARLEEVAHGQQLDGRVRFTGRVGPDELTDLYARCLAVFYAPRDEDFGMVPYEAFLAQKAVITTRDAGGPLEIVANRRNGLICDPAPESVATAVRWLSSHREDARTWGRAGREAALRVTWDVAIDRLLSA